MTDKPQVDKLHYAFLNYAFEGRFVSYYWQLREVLALLPRSVLEVGAGDRVFGNFLKDNTDVSYQSVDIAPDLKPDVVGSIVQLPFPDRSFDVACAFEVLEHLSFEQFDTGVKELARVAQTHVVISIPHFGPMLSLAFKIPFIPQIRLAIKIPFPKRHTFNGQHYWEVGTQSYPASLIRRKLSTHGKVVRDFIPFGNPYHHFFVVQLKSGISPAA